MTPLRNGLRSDAAKQHQDDDDDKHRAKHTRAGMTEAIAIAPDAPAESAEQENDKNDDQDRTE